MLLIGCRDEMRFIVYLNLVKNMKEEEKNINVLFGKRVRQLREQKGISQEHFGFDVGLHRTYIGQIERAEKNITLKNIEKIAKQLNVNVSELLDFSKLDDFDEKPSKRRKNQKNIDNVDEKN